MTAIIITAIICVTLVAIAWINKDRPTAKWDSRIEKNADLPTLEEAERNQIKKYFKGKCPYTDKQCEDWRCQDCEVEASEKIYGKRGNEE